MSSVAREVLLAEKHRGQEVVLSMLHTPKSTWLVWNRPFRGACGVGDVSVLCWQLGGVRCLLVLVGGEMPGVVGHFTPAPAGISRFALTCWCSRTPSSVSSSASHLRLVARGREDNSAQRNPTQPNEESPAGSSGQLLDDQGPLGGPRSWGRWVGWEHPKPFLLRSSPSCCFHLSPCCPPRGAVWGLEASRHRFCPLAALVLEEAGKLSSQGGFPSPAPLCVVTSVCRTYGVQEAPFLGEIPANSQHIRVSYF